MHVTVYVYSFMQHMYEWNQLTQYIDVVLKTTVLVSICVTNLLSTFRLFEFNDNLFIFQLIVNEFIFSNEGSLARQTSRH